MAIAGDYTWWAPDFLKKFARLVNVHEGSKLDELPTVDFSRSKANGSMESLASTG